MAKIPRNHPCPCGSGLKYKRCHGAFVAPPPTKRGPSPTVIAEGMSKLMAKVADMHAFEQKHGAVKEILSAPLGDVRAVAVGKVLHWANNWKVFPDFLFAYIAHQLWNEHEWNRQKALPEIQQHPAMQWHTAYADAVGASPRNEKDQAVINLGGALAYVRLAYDLYLQEHNAELKKRLIERLRDPTQFQGARFEAVVAAVMLTADYELSFTTDKGPAGARPEFVATHRKNGQQLAVEAKSRHRATVMGFRQDKPRILPVLAEVQGLMRDALAKAGTMPLLIFIEINMPVLAADAGSVSDELRRDWEAIKSEYSPDEFPAVGVVFYNDVAPWHVKTPVPEGYNAWSLAIPCDNRFKLDARPLLETVTRATMQRADIPQEFPAAT